MADKLIQTRNVGRRKVVDRIAEVLALADGKKVLHLGCADYPFTEKQGDRLLHRRLLGCAGELWGVDASVEGVARLREMGFENIVLGDVERLAPELVGDQFDVIVAGEIIEHLAAPGAFLNAVRSIMSRKTELVITTPNAFGFKVFVHSLFGREKVHPHHNYYFSYYTITQLLEKCGFVCKDIYYCQEVRGEGASLAVDRCLGLVPKVWPLLADGLFVRAGIDWTDEHRMKGGGPETEKLAAVEI